MSTSRYRSLSYPCPCPFTRESSCYRVADRNGKTDSGRQDREIQRNWTINYLEDVSMYVVHQEHVTHSAARTKRRTICARWFQAYSAMSPNGESAAPILGSAVTSAASLPPMSTFRGSAAVAANSGTGAPSPASLQYSHSPGAPTTAPSAPNAAPTTNQQSTTDDTLGKTLASVVSNRVRVRENLTNSLG